MSLLIALLQIPHLLIHNHVFGGVSLSNSDEAQVFLFIGAPMLQRYY